MEIARYWRLNQQRYQLKGNVCTSCGKPFFPPHPVCDNCQQADAGAREMDVFALVIPMSLALTGNLDAQGVPLMVS